MSQVNKNKQTKAVAVSKDTIRKVKKVTYIIRAYIFQNIYLRGVQYSDYVKNFLYLTPKDNTIKIWVKDLNNFFNQR